MKDDRVCFMPYWTRWDGGNDYATKLIELLKRHFYVDGSLSDWTDIYRIKHTQAIFLEWTEQYLTQDMKHRLMIYKYMGTKLVWTLHNRTPHDDENDSGKNNMNWLADKSDIIIVHSQSSTEYIPGKANNQRKARFVPHIQYDYKPDEYFSNKLLEKYDINENVVAFLVFGFIKKYKNIESCIRAFIQLNKSNSRLIIAGEVIDTEYAEMLKNTADSNPNIYFEYGYTSRPMLDCLLYVSDVVVIPYHTDTCLNSGVMFHAFSGGKPVIMTDMPCALDYKDKDYMYLFADNGLYDQMLRAYTNGKNKNRIFGIEASDDMHKNNNSQIVEKKLVDLVNGV